jgi:hypothetical protein
MTPDKSPMRQEIRSKHERLQEIKLDSKRHPNPKMEIMVVVLRDMTPRSKRIPDPSLPQRSPIENALIIMTDWGIWMFLSKAKSTMTIVYVMLPQK